MPKNLLERLGLKRKKKNPLQVQQVPQATANAVLQQQVQQPQQQQQPPPRPQTPTPNWVPGDKSNRPNNPQVQLQPQRQVPQPQIVPTPTAQLQTPPNPTTVNPIPDQKPQIEELESFELDSQSVDDTSDMTPEQVVKLSKRAEQAIKQFKAGMANPKLDSSGFILQGIQVLGYVLGPSANSALQSISKQYQNQDYQSAKESLVDLASDGGQKVDPEIVSLLKSKSKGLQDDPEANESRRFFETRMASHLEESLEKSGAFKSVQGLSQAMQGLGFNPGPVTDMKSAQGVLLNVAGFNDRIELGLKKDSPKYQAKDRTERPKHDPESEDRDERLSRNPGIMKANAPNFTDSVSSRDQKNRVPDRNTLDENKTDGFSATHEEVPFVASISGTSFSLVKLLEGFMSANSQDPQLATKVNDIVKMFVATYIKMGFHSYGEMTHVLDERNIQKLFAKYNVNVDLTLPQGVLEQATKDAEDYARTTSVKSAMHEELKAKVKPTPEHVSAYTVLKGGKVQTFTGRPNQVYVAFGSEQERSAAVEQIAKEYGDKSFRIASLANAIEIFDDLKKLLGIKPPPPKSDEVKPEKTESDRPVTSQGNSPQESTPTAPESAPTKVEVVPERDALGLLRKGKVTKFNDRPGRIYVLFGSENDRVAATDAIDDEYGASSYRVTVKAGMIEIFSDLQGLLGL